MAPTVHKHRMSSSSTTSDARYTSTKSKRSNLTKKHPRSEEKNPSRNAVRERCRVKSLRNAFQNLQKCLPSVPPNTKLSKLDVLILATTYISHLSRILSEDDLLHESCFSTNDLFQMDSSMLDCFSSMEPEPRNPNWEKSYLHPVRKWPMRSRLYAGVEENDATIKAQWY